MDQKRYVPVLRWRPAEQQALRDLSDVVRKSVTPILELLPSRTPLYDDLSRREYLNTFVARLSEVWGPQRAFVDAQLLRPHFLIAGRSPLNELLSRARDNGLDVVPVLPLARKLDDPHLDVFASGTTRDAGLCLRLKPIDLVLADQARNRHLNEQIKYLGLSPESVDLVVDEEFTTDLAPGYAQICEMIPYLKRWRSFAVISGGFPVDLQEFHRGQIHSLRRRDWQRWRTESSSRRLMRRPSYGDYTVQYAAYRPPPLDQVPRTSVSVRYTADEEWIICRGEALSESGPGTEQWIGWAQLLKSRPEYTGEEFSAGDRYISERAGGAASTGNFTTWIAAAINHHITLTAKQIAILRAA